MQECAQIGELCVREVLLRNTDIQDRVSQPDLFDRFGKLKPDASDALDSLMERMSLSQDRSCVFE